MSIRKVLSYILLWTLTEVVNAQTGDLPRVSPESQGVSSSDIKTYFDNMLSCPTGEPHGIMILRHGKVIGELFPKPFDASYPQMLYSVAKSFVGIAVGLAIEENRLRLTDRVASFFPDLLPDSISDNLASMTVRDLLTMTSGIQPDPLMRTTGADWIRRYLAKPAEKPGETFHYDSMCSYLLSAIVQRVTGQKLLDYLMTRIFIPMHISVVEWEESPEGINTGGWGLRMQVESMAKIGQLLLNKGNWEGKQLISSEWVEEMTSSLQETGMMDTYGYHIWRCDYPNAYRADGALGQYIIVAPDEDMVVAITQANTSNGVAERHLVWDLLRKVKSEPLHDTSGYVQLQKAQSAYSLPTVDMGKRNIRSLSKMANQTFTLGANGLDWKSVRFEPGKDTLRVIVTTTTDERYTILAGRGEWLTTHTDAYPPYSIRAVGRFKGIHGPFHVAGCYGGNTSELILKVRYTSWGSGADLHFQQAKGQLSLQLKENGKRKAYGVEMVVEGKELKSHPVR
jgi:CubicO group peptidase (beta-lactamase class C family)